MNCLQNFLYMYTGLYFQQYSNSHYVKLCKHWGSVYVTNCFQRNFVRYTYYQIRVNLLRSGHTIFHTIIRRCYYLGCEILLVKSNYFTCIFLQLHNWSLQPLENKLFTSCKQALVFKHGYPNPMVEFVPSGIELTPLIANNKINVSAFSDYKTQSLFNVRSQRKQ